MKLEIEKSLLKIIKVDIIIFKKKYSCTKNQLKMITRQELLTPAAAIGNA